MDTTDSTGGMDLTALKNRTTRWRSAVAVVGAGLFLSACASGGGGFGDLFGGNDAPVIPPPPSEEAEKVTGRTAANTTIPVLVDDNPITKYDIDQRVKLMRIGGVPGGREEATEELIDELVQMIEAQRKGLRLDSRQINASYAGIGKRLEMTTAQLDAALKSEGIDPKSLKSRLQAQATWAELVRRRAMSEAQISSSDLTTALLQQGDPDSITMKEYVLQQIIFVVPAGSASAAYSQRRREANAFRQRYRGCESVLDQTRDLKSVVVKNIGRRSDEQLSGQQSADLAKTPPNGTTEPFQTELGVEVIAVCSSKDVQSASVARDQIKNKYALDQADDLGKDYLKSLRDRSIIVYR